MCGIAPLIGAGPTDTIEVTLDPQASASITVDQSTWTPSCKLNEDNSTAIDWATITNDGDVNVSVTIDAENSENWTIAGSASHNQFKLEVLGALAIVLTASPQPFITDLPTDAGDNTETLGLKITMPSTSSSSDAQHVTITFEATTL